MSRFHWPAAAWLAVALAAAAPRAGAQQPNTPHVAYVYPAGGQRGTSFQVRVGGRFLDGTRGVLVSGEGVRAEVAGYDRPLNPQQINALREKLQELQKKGNDPAARREILDLRLQIGDSVRRNASPAFAEIVTLDVTIAPGVEPGARQLRLATPLGLSNPLVFAVGDLPEVREPDPPDRRPVALLPGANALRAVQPRPGPPAVAAAMEIALPAVVNGRLVPGEDDRTLAPARQATQYAPGDVDRFRFQGRKGQQLVVAVSARALQPYLADAVPGWFQATLALFDAGGHEVAYDDDYGAGPDPVLHFQVPEAGEYTVEIKDALYRGREDFVYRIAIGELPFVTTIFPMGGRAGNRTNVDVAGWNLPSSRATMDDTKRGPGVYSLSVRSGDVWSNRVAFAADTLPEAFEREPNDSAGGAQRVVLPSIVNGRVDRPGDWDLFRFEGRAGDRIVAEVEARRLGSPLDSVLEVTDGAGRRLAINDDHDDKAAGLVTHQADSYVAVTLPADGAYVVRLGDVQHKGGPEYAYRLRIGPPRPDFDLRVTPSSINGSGSASVPIEVHAIRRDGFDGDIALALRDAPAGFALSGAVVPAGAERVRLTLTVPPAPTEEPVAVRLEGRATVGGRAVVREAVPADDLMQAFAYRHLVPADALRVSVSARGATRVPVRVLTAQPVRIPAGGAARVRVVLPPAYRLLENVQFELSEPPDGLSLDEVARDAGGAQFVLLADAARMKAGLRGNLIVTVSGERTPAARGGQPPAAQAARRRIPLGALPAIPFEIVK